MYKRQKVRFTVLQEVLEKCGDDKDALSEELSARCDALIPKHIIIDDIMASINYLNCIADGLGTTDDIDHLGNRDVYKRQARNLIRDFCYRGLCGCGVADHFNDLR